MTIQLYHKFGIITSPKSQKGFWSSKLYQTYGVGNLFCRRRPCGQLGHSPLGLPPFTHARQMARLLSKKNSMFETSFKQRLFLLFECRANRARLFAKSQTKKREQITQKTLSLLCLKRQCIMYQILFSIVLFNCCKHILFVDRKITAV